MTSLPQVTEWVRSLVPDLDARVEAFEVDATFLDDELVEAFKEEIAGQSALMNKGIESGNLDDVRMAAHSVKGMGGTIGLPEISVLAHEIELRAKADDAAGCESLVLEFVAWACEFTGV